MFVRILLGILLDSMSWICDVLAEQLFIHVWQEEEGLDERVEVACVPYVLETNRQLGLPFALIVLHWLSIKARLDGCCYCGIICTLIH